MLPKSPFPLWNFRTFQTSLVLLFFWLTTAALFHFFGNYSHFRWWPLGVLCGTALQWMLHQLSIRAIHRQLTTHPLSNDWLSQIFVFTPLAQKLSTLRVLESSRPLGFEEEIQSWQRTLPFPVLVISGLLKLIQIDWIDRRVPAPHSSVSAKTAMLLGICFFTAGIHFSGLWKETVLFWVFPWFTFYAALSQGSYQTSDREPPRLRLIS
jgi:hypothetical protein